MWKLLAFVLALKAANGFFFVDPTLQGAKPLFNNPFWKNFENSMKELEASLKSSTGGITADSVEDSEAASSEIADMEPGHHGMDMAMEMFPVSMFGMGGSRPWYMGKNVCVTREETDLASESDDAAGFGGMRTKTETCAGGNGRYTCTATVRGGGKHVRTTVKYECCHGHRLQRQRCVQVSMANLTETARANAPEFSRMLETAGVLERLEKEEENFTLFVAGDETLDDLRDNFQQMNQLELLVPVTRRRRAVPPTPAPEAIAEARGADVEPALTKVLLNHVVKGLLHSADMTNNQVVESLSGDKLRVNVYTSPLNPIVTVNCKRVLRADKMADKGLVHVLDGVLKPVQRSLAQVLREDDRFSIFRSMLEEAGLMERLARDALTVFAPTDAAFRAHAGGLSCAGAIARHHVTPHVLCTAGLVDSWSVATLSGEHVKLVRSADAVLVDGHARVSLADVVATNGVVHVLDEVLLPNAARNISDVLESRNLTTFQSLLTEVGLDNSDANVTWFAPREEAFAKPEAQATLDRLRGDPAKLRQLVLYHSSQPQLELEDLENDQNISTRADDRSLRFNLYSSGPMFSLEPPRATVNCARVRMTDSRACGANVHEVDRLLVPPAGDLLQVLQDRPEFGILNKVIKQSGLEEELRQAGPMTLLAPTDDAFNDLPARVLNQLLADQDKARQVLSMHILPESVCCHGVSGQQWLWPHHVATKAGLRLQARRDSFGHVHFGRTRVSQCDQVATNGIVHTVARVLVPQEDRHSPFSSLSLDDSISGVAGVRHKGTKNPNVELMLFGL